MCDFCRLYYVADQNVVTDEEGDIVYDIFNYVTPNEFLLFKHNKKDLITDGRYGQLVELVYFDDPGFNDIDCNFKNY